ncbi:casein kinase II subunit alpha-1-like [Puntigrus tetrazona]|uniref:casein kinase II subunit alpha-1-like n=1 Tax=Puntigrus tetrazona TaxID=1606681 RepID=UPI001C8A0FD7|nr:casein kinase II subunit alpha-1-like [Puntigrus tetrazona]
MGLFSKLKKAFKGARAHEPDPCVLLKYSPERRGRRPKFWGCRLLHFFRRKAGKYNLAKAEEVCQKEAALYRRLNDGQTSLQQGCVVVEIHDHQDPPVSEVLPAIEKLLEPDVPQQLDVNIPASLNEEDKVEELAKDQICLQDNCTEDNEVEEQDDNHVFWQYEFGPQLGKGGGGCVYAATRCTDGLKPGHPSRLPLEIGLTLLANEDPSVPYIIKLLDWQDNPDYYVMVLERPMPSMSLFSFVKVRQRLREGQAQHFMWQVLQAANICCERGVFHRDIKLENLLVNPDTLEVKLIDFGCGELMKDTDYVTFSAVEMH